VIDHALTHPWTVTKHYHRSPNPRPWWVEDNCMENNNHIRIQGEPYFTPPQAPELNSVTVDPKTTALLVPDFGKNN
jgi:hypothetical protein